MPKIFFCYRREDSDHQAGRLFDHLVSHYGAEKIFKDVNSIQLGRDFRKILAENVAQCDVFLALIGDRWLSAVKADGERRLDDPTDFVRFEIESALNRDIQVIPVLVGRTTTAPKQEDLPKSIQALAFRQSIQVRPDPDFCHDIERLIHNISRVPHITATHSKITPNNIGTTGTSFLKPPVAAHLSNNDLARPITGEPNGISSFFPSPANRLGILLSGNATYVNDIKDAFLKYLNADLLASNYNPITPSLGSVEWELDKRMKWREAVKRLMKRGGKEGFQYLVAIGTQAAIALQETLGTDFGTIPTLFLGVTYPKLCGIVDSEHYRSENKYVTGVRFGCGLDAVSSLLSNKLFPNRQLYFVYQRGIPQDEMGCLDLANTRLAREKKLKFKSFQRRLKDDDLEDPDAVYFSWYTFTRLFHEDEASILEKRLVISIMPDNVRDGLAVAGVGTDHSWIGRQGATILMKHYLAPLDNKPNWGKLDVVVSPLVYWLNPVLANEQWGIKFCSKALEDAKEIFK